MVDAYTAMLQSPSLTWLPFSIQVNVDVPVVSWFVEFYGQGGATERQTNVYFDEMTLTLVPEPAATPAILAAIVFSCLGVRRHI